jgi:cation:H+ antiporter
VFIFSLFILVKSAEYAVRYSSRIARVFHISEFIVSFFIISVISVFPEATVSIISAIQGIPEFGLGTLLGSNIADLSLVFGIVALFSAKGITIKSQILKNDFFYLILLLIPVILGFDGYYSRIDGIILIVSSIVFFITLSIESKMFKKKFNNDKNRKWVKNLFLLIISLGFLITSGYYTVTYGVFFANDMKIPSVLVALTIVAIGTCLPELIFSIKAIKLNHNELALGDILGTVITDATLIIGIISLIHPFVFNPLIIYVTGIMMFIAGVLVIIFIRTGKILTKTEGLYLLLFYILSLIIGFVVNALVSG